MRSDYVPWKILSGQVFVGSLTEGWNLNLAEHDANEERSFDFSVLFTASYLAVPVVQISLVGFDLDQRKSPRILLEATHITHEGFNARITTWRDTQIYSVSFNWLAIGA